MTAESLPVGESLVARMLPVEIKGKIGSKNADVKKDILSKCQGLASEGKFAALTSSYVFWLSQEDRLEQARREIEKAKLKWRARDIGGHSRIPDSLSQFDGAFITFLQFAKDVKAISVEEADGLEKRSNRALEYCAQTQKQRIFQVEPALRFIEFVSSGLSSQKCHVSSKGGTWPEQAEKWGWRKCDGNPDSQYFESKGEQIGWVDDKNLYLIPKAATSLVNTLAERAGEPLGLDSTVFGRSLVQKGFINKHKEGRSTLQYRISDTKKRVWHIPIITFEQATSSLSF